MKRPVARKSRKREDSKVGDLEKRLAEALKHEAEALEQQTATAEILRVISSSPTDAQPVFDAIASRGARLCDADFCIVFRFDGAMITLAAHDGRSPGTLDVIRAAYPAPPGRRSISARTIFERRVVSIADAQDPSAHPPGFEGQADRARAVGYRSILAVPMLRDDAAIGAINVARLEVRPFSDGEIALLQTFADQAVIAIENVRLFKELQGKNEALTEAHAQVSEALERQTATSEILRVISRSQTDVQPVFDTIVQSAVRLCAGLFGAVFQFDGELLHMVAHHNYTPEALEVAHGVYPARPSRDHGSVRAIVERAVVHIPDVELDPEHQHRELRRAIGQRSGLFVPMLREGDPIGVIMVSRPEPGPFSNNEIELLKTFADQAVIAIENVRLFKELEGRNRDLTATSEILRVISSSPTDVQPVFDTIVRSAVALCDGLFSALFQFDGELIHQVAHHNFTLEALEAQHRVYPARPGRSFGAGRAILECAVVHIPDVELDPEYRYQSVSRAIGFRSGLWVPMLREGNPIGVISVSRAEPGPFADTEIELLKTFADQAVIAIENVRLFKELEASNREIADKSRQLEVASQHKSEFLANMSHELRTPLNAVIGFSEVLSDQMFGALNEKQEEYMKDIHASGQHLLSLINDILDLSKIEAGRMELERTNFDVRQAIANALMLVRERAVRRGITLRETIDERLGQITADERKVKQVLLNLLSNAIKFTPEGGRIEVVAVPKDGLVEVSVSDTGAGIAPEDQEAVFEEFRQVGTVEKKAEGTGLGLTLCRKFVELHGGRIWVQSQVDVGSTFTFTIPVRRGG